KISSSANSATDNEKTIPATTAKNVIAICIVPSGFVFSLVSKSASALLRFPLIGILSCVLGHRDFDRLLLSTEHPCNFFIAFAVDLDCITHLQHCEEALHVAIA